MRLSNIQRYIFESILVYIILPYCGIAFAFSIAALGLAIILSLIIMPIYSILSPLRFNGSIKWLIPIINGLLMIIPIKFFINNNFYIYIPYFVTAGYIAIIIKILYRKFFSKS